MHVEPIKGVLVGCLFSMVVLGGCFEDYTGHCNCAGNEICAANVGMCEDEKYESVTCCPVPQACVDAAADPCGSGACRDAMQLCGKYPLMGSCKVKSNGTIAFEACD